MTDREASARSMSAVVGDAPVRPWRHGFLPLVRRLAAADPVQPPIGTAQRPQQESFRLGQQASLAFAPRELAKVEIRAGSDQRPRAHLKLFGLGMLGPHGALPIHFTELVRERVEARRDTTLADFIDLFHHRAFTHIYRAWAQSQSAAGLDRPDEEIFSAYVARLAGDEPSEVQDSALAPHARWASSAHRVRAARNPDGLVSTLSRFFGVPVALHEFVLQWMPIEPQDQCVLGQPRRSSVLGEGAVAGEVVPDRQNRFRLVIGPLDLEGYLRLTPQGGGSGKDLPALVEIVRSFIGFEYLWEVELLIGGVAAPQCRLGDTTQLGWSTWMAGARASRGSVTGMVFEPESYGV
ncbi:type VI secretion system protein ImpH [Variovorax sp. PvP013]